MYEVLSAWEDLDLSGQPAHIAEFAEIWRDTDKIVYSRTLQDVSTSRTRLERDFDPETIRRLKATSRRTWSSGGRSWRARRCRQGSSTSSPFLSPAAVGGGKQALAEGMRLDLELLEERRFGNGTVYLRYRAV